MGAIQKHYGRKTKTQWEREGASTVFFLSKYFAFERVSTLTTRNNNRYIGTIYIK